MRATRAGARVRVVSRRLFSDSKRPAPEPQPSEAHQQAATTMYRKQRPEPVRAANPMNPQVAPQPVAKTSIHTTAAREVPVNRKLKPDLHQMKPPKSAAHLYREQRLNKSSSAGEPPKMPNEGAGPSGPGVEPENPTARNIGILGVASVAAFSIWWYYSHKDPLEDFYKQEAVNIPDVEPLTAEDLQVNNPQAQQPLWLQRPRDSGSS